MKLVFTSIDYTKIKIIESALKSQNLRVTTKGEDLDVLNGVIPRHSNLIEVYVADDDFENAINIIETGIEIEDSIEENTFDNKKLNRYESIKKISLKKDKIALLNLLCGILLISNIFFFILFLTQIDKNIKLKNSITNSSIEYDFDNDDNCLRGYSKSNLILLSEECFENNSDIRKYAKYFNFEGILKSEYLNPYNLEFDTIEILYDKFGTKISEFIDFDQDGNYDEWILYDKNGILLKKYKDINKDYRFDESERAY
ncbi:putative signal transducing protein [Leptospira perdikensis]|uniref:putative signal transducing protein n=1 Tax=Leptospira perdikensis TaxID=2484948 RepID=UPI00142D70BD|nr:DUF2007 domain-containing protein [Leptospira perdikensis]